jgi:hypothetical protein
MNWGNEEVSDEDKQEKKPTQAAKSKYAYGDSDTSDSGKRVHLNKKEKLNALIKEKYLKIRDGVENKNYVDILEAFEKVMKEADKIKKEFGDKLPALFIRSLFLVEESLNIQKKDKEGFSRENNTASNSLKKSFKLAKTFEDAIKSHKNAEFNDEEYLEEDKLSDLSDRDRKELSDVSSEVDYTADKAEDPAIRRLKWVKKPTKAKTPVPETDVVKPIKKKVVKNIKQYEEQDSDESEPEEKVKSITDADIEKECNEITNQRGHFQRPLEIISRIDHLLKNTQNIYLKIKLLNLSVLICFDTSPGQFSALSLEMWNKIYDSIVTLLASYNSLNTLKSKDETQIQQISTLLQTSMISILEKLEIELYKAMQYTDQNSSEYISRLRDELKFLLLCSKVEVFYAEFNDQVSISKVYLMIILHIYYKNEESIKKMIERFNLNLNRDEYLIKSCENPEKFITSLCNKIYQYNDEKVKIKAMLCNIYFLCIHNQYESAKNLFKRSCVFELIHLLKDDGLKIIYNRTLTQLGLCAFRTGKYTDSFQYLNPLCSTGTSKLKEFLAQSYNKEMEKSSIFFEKEEKKRMIPYIMTINIDEIESTYYLVSMIIDLPNILLFKLGKNYKPFNLIFKKLLENYEKQIFNGPPETIKELILSSTSFLTKGDWKNCSDLINTLKIYNHHKNENIKNILNNAIKETGLKCFIIFYSNQYSSFSLENLSKKMQLDKQIVKKIVNEMILDRTINGKWNNNTLHINNEEFNWSMIRHLEENLNTITEQNLALLEAVSSSTTK